MKASLMLYLILENRLSSHSEMRLKVIQEYQPSFEIWHNIFDHIDFVLKCQSSFAAVFCKICCGSISNNLYLSHVHMESMTSRI